ncbi:scavenger mRNA decapping enzyme [Phlebopus sp. FC_14]|nr:scavenger mRNA decapping enzyme [Phlebopus sp. FC_14]
MAFSMPLLQEFQFKRVLDENPNFHFLFVLGTLPAPMSETSTGAACSPSDRRLPAILRFERMAFPLSLPERLSSGVLTSVKHVGNSDIYTWMHGWLERKEDLPDVKIDIIFPATEVHIRKYSKQDVLMVHETPELYKKIVKPYIDAFPASRTQWVQDVLSGVSEADRVLARTASFVILPDMKWDPNTNPISSLYLLALVFDPSIRSLRDLRGGEGGHVKMLLELRDAAHGVVRREWGLREGSVRLYVHYQPSYYHFHVHIVHASQSGMMGMTVGQAHLLDDIISMLNVSPTIFSELTFTYGLGSQHGLHEAMVAAQGKDENGNVGQISDGSCV